VTGQLQSVNAQQQEHEAALAAAHAARDEADAAAARLERQLAVLGKERDGLKRILASYQQDEARRPLALFACDVWHNLQSTAFAPAAPLYFVQAEPLCFVPGCALSLSRPGLVQCIVGSDAEVGNALGTARTQALEGALQALQKELTLVSDFNKVRRTSLSTADWLSIHIANLCLGIIDCAAHDSPSAARLQAEAALKAKGEELSYQQAEAAAERQCVKAAEAAAHSLEAEAERLSEQVASMQVRLGPAASLELPRLC
jgi:hypothetical protein